MAKKITALSSGLLGAIVFVVSVLGLGASAQADSAVWTLREIRRAQGSLDYCVADHALPDGRHINLAIDPEGRLNLGLLLPNQTFTAQDKRDLRIGFDKGKAEPMVGRALTAHVMLVDIPNAAQWLTQWAQSRQLHIAGLGQKQVYPLVEAAVILDKLSHCAEQQGRAVPAVMLDLLHRAGLDDGLTIIPPPASLGFVDFAWQRGALNGGTQAFTPEPDFRTAVRGQRAILKNYCQGLWSEEMDLILVSGKTMQQQGVLTCRASGHDEVMAILFYTAGDGKARYYTHAGVERESVVAATTALAKALTGAP